MGPTWPPRRRKRLGTAFFSDAARRLWLDCIIFEIVASGCVDTRCFGHHQFQPMGELLKYPNPPILQLMLTILFENPMPLSLLDLAEINGLFTERYPVFSETVRAGGMATDPRDPPAAPESHLPRVQFSTPTLSQGILLQEDRISFFWNRLTPLTEAPDYPSFDEMKKGLREELYNLHLWIAEKGWGPLKPKTIEVAYSNAFRLMIGDKRRRVSEILTFFGNPRPSLMIVYSVMWTELLRQEEMPLVDGSPASGMIIVTTAPGMGPDNAPIIGLNLVATSSVPTGEWDTLEEIFSYMHIRLTEIFESSVHPLPLREP